LGNELSFYKGILNPGQDTLQLNLHNNYMLNPDCTQKYDFTITAKRSSFDTDDPTVYKFKFKWSQNYFFWDDTATWNVQKNKRDFLFGYTSLRDEGSLTITKADDGQRMILLLDNRPSETIPFNELPAVPGDVYWDILVEMNPRDCKTCIKTFKIKYNLWDYSSKNCEKANLHKIWP
jgi:hypothetical protein